MKAAAKQPRESKRSLRARREFLIRLELRSHPNLLCVVRGTLEPLMEILGFAAENSRSVIRAVDEAVSNIMRHAYGGRVDQFIGIYCSSLRLGVSAKPGVEILLFDGGPAVDPTKIRPRPLEELRPGGLGLHIIRASMDAVEYKRAGDFNQLRLVKHREPSKRT